MQLTISAIITVYNRDQYIGRAIDSILHQDHPVSELIVIDDGSVDDTRKVVESYGDKVRYVYQDNQGVAGARNRGIQEAQHEWIAFLDSDDFWLPHYIAKMVEAINATKQTAELYFCDLLRDHKISSSSHWDLCHFSIPPPYQVKIDASEWAFMDRQPMMLQASVIRRDTYLALGGFPENIKTREDTYLFYKLALLFPVCAVSCCGGAMGSEAVNRLTALYSSLNGQAFWEATVFIFRDILYNSGNLKHYHASRLRKFLTSAYLSRGRHYFKTGRYYRFSISLAQSFFTNPKFFLREIGRSIYRKLPS
jgi:glycosyltransferase involved in cell wall biosynthesis